MGFDRIFRSLTSGVAVALLAVVAVPVLAQTAPVPAVPTRVGSPLTPPTITRPVALGVTWPKVSEVERMDGNGISFYGGVASIDGSDQYGLSVLTFDPFKSSIRAIYIDAWALNAPDAASCALTFRHVERPLTQEQANALTPELANVELQTIEEDHPDLVKLGAREHEGTGVVRLVDKFSWGPAEARVDGLSKSWVFIRLGQAYYVNKVCLSKTGLADLTVIDQLIGLNYRTGDAPIPTPGDRVPENPPPSHPLVYLPPPVGNIVARDQDQQALESQTLSGAEGESAQPAAPPAAPPAAQPRATPPAPALAPARAPEPVPAPVSRTPAPASVPTPVPAPLAATPQPAASGSVAPVVGAPAPAPAPAPAAPTPAVVTFVSSPPAAPPAAAPVSTVARSLTRSLNAGPPTP
jgi:hypothetical protein